MKMNKKESFLKLVNSAISSMPINPIEDGFMTKEEYDGAIDFLKELSKEKKSAEKPKLTETGKLILETMQIHREEKDNVFSAKLIAELAFVSSRGVSGAMRKLVNDGFCEKNGQDPIIYSLTEMGINEII